MFDMPRWSETNQETWSAVRARGQTRYLLVNGVLAWGMPMFVLMAGGPVFFGFPYDAEPSLSYWGWQALLWATAGVMYGLWMWSANEASYQRFEQSNRRSDPSA